jgi:hypothetical protein
MCSLFCHTSNVLVVRLASTHGPKPKEIHVLLAQLSLLLGPRRNPIPFSHFRSNHAAVASANHLALDTSAHPTAGRASESSKWCPVRPPCSRPWPRPPRRTAGGRATEAPGLALVADVGDQDCATMTLGKSCGGREGAGSICPCAAAAVPIPL